MPSSPPSWETARQMASTCLHHCSELSSGVQREGETTCLVPGRRMLLRPSVRRTKVEGLAPCQAVPPHGGSAWQGAQETLEA